MELSPTLLAAILFSPLLAFFLQILIVSRRVRQPRLSGAILSLLGVGIPLVLVLGTVGPELFHPTATVWAPEEPFRWIDLGPLAFRVGLMVDNTAKLLLFMVTLVCSMITLFSVAYMRLRDGELEPRYPQFFAYLSLFTFAMLLLSLSDNLLTLFIGWELMGLCSYLLIGFYHERKSAQDAAIKAFLTTRVGDVLLLVGLAVVWAAVGSLRFPEIAEGVHSGALTGWLLTLAGLLLFAGAVGKSAQFPLHTWLPDAMEGPTPVSALIHAATMVAAGVYLTARLLQVGLLDDRVLLIVAYGGGFTALFAASIALVQTDIKRVLAYSTISQLGYMMLAVGVGNYLAALFHLLTHAFFKACLFLGSGSVIFGLHEAFHRHGVHADAQDMRNMGGLRRRMPWTFATFLIATLALSGVPLTAGFLSKDAILAGTLAYVAERPEHLLLAVFGFGAAALTAFYMFRLIFWTFTGEPAARAEQEAAPQIRTALAEVRESSWVMVVPLIVLAFFALWIFWSINPMTEGWIPEVLSGQADWLPGAAHPEAAHGPESVRIGAMLLSLMLAFGGILTAAMFYYARRWSTDRWARSQFARILEAKYGFDHFYAWAFVQNAHRLSRWAGQFDLRIIDGAVNGIGYLVAGARHSFTGITGAIDRYVVDGAVNGVAWMLSRFSAGLRRMQTGYLQNYLLVVFTGLVALAFLISAALR